MGWTLSRKSLQHALAMVERGRVSDESWDAAEAEKKLLGDPPDWERYALWHLAYDSEKDPETKAAYGYPYGDGENVFRRAVAAIKARAAQQGEDTIRAAADQIWHAIEEAEKAAPSPVVKFCAATIGMEDRERRRITLVAATEDRDRAGDIIRIEGMSVDEFLKNPVVLAGHGMFGDVPVVGKAVSLTKEQGKLLCTVEFLPPGVSELADKVFNIVTFLGKAAASVGIIVKEFAPLPDRGIEITKSELLEISVVPVPANPNAVASLKAAGDGNDRDAVLARTLELATELVSELAALVTALSDRLPPEKGQKPGTIRIRRA